MGAGIGSINRELSFRSIYYSLRSGDTDHFYVCMQPYFTILFVNTCSSASRAGRTSGTTTTSSTPASTPMVAQAIISRSTKPFREHLDRYHVTYSRPLSRSNVNIGNGLMVDKSDLNDLKDFQAAAAPGRAKLLADHRLFDEDNMMVIHLNTTLSLLSIDQSIVIINAAL
jgi:hypothetical protein